jgi:hypothetical protein
MAKLKLLKMPKAPRLPKKPAATASLSTKQGWLRRVQDMKAKYEAKERAVFKENTERKKMNEASKKLSTVIAGVGDILSVRPGSFKAVITRKKRTAKVSGVKHKRKPAKKTAKKKAAPRRRR